MKTVLSLARMKTPIGSLVIASSAKGAAAIELDGDEERLRAELARWWPEAEAREDERANRPLIREIEAYFAGKLRRFEVPVEARGTEFQRRVWARLRRIPYGMTLAYGEVAAAIGRPHAARAVGMACNRNPVPLLIPCHRVVGADGSLVGFGGGVDIKARLLKLEGLGGRHGQA